jgi:hypothetical protein
MSIKLLTAEEQTKVEAEIRRMILEFTAQNGGVSDLARKMSVVYDRAWNQLNRNQGVRAGFIPAYVVASGDRRPLDILAEAAGFRVVSKEPAKLSGENLHRQLVDISIDCGRTQEMIEAAYEDRRVTAQEYRRVHALCNQLIDLISRIDDGIKREAV